MSNDTAADFTRTAAAMVARNDRHAWLRALRRHLLRSVVGRVAIAWSALTLAAFVLVVLPVNIRVA